MRKILVSMTTIFMLLMALIVSPQHLTTRAQTQNQTSHTEITESFTFPNECTNELMDVVSTSVVNCHDQLRADGTFDEKCQIRQSVTAVGQTTGITFSGVGTFTDTFTATNPCNFHFTNSGSVRLISQGSDVNLILTFNDTVRMESCVLTTDSHLGSADCRGRNQ